MPDLGDSLAASLVDPGPRPAGGADLVKWAGGRKALAQQLSGMSGPPQKSDYATPAEWKAASVKWRSADRRAQRLDDEGKPGKQRRGVNRTTFAPEQEARVREAAVDRKWSALYRHGARVRMHVRLRVPSPGKRRPDVRTRWLPSGGPGELIPPDELDDVLRDVEGDPDRAAFELMAAFGESYGFEGLADAEVEEVLSLKIWPEGTPEPP